MKIVVSIFFLFIFQVTTALAQKNPSGFYVSPKNDTVFGEFTNYQQWFKNPSKVDFLPNSATNTISLTPDNCKLFSITGYDVYVTKNTKRMRNVIDFTRLSSSPEEYQVKEDIYENVKGFFHLVFENNMLKMYEYTDGVRTNLYIEDSTGNLTELKFKAFLNNLDKPVYVRDYQIQLQLILAERLRSDTKLEGKVFFLEYNSEDISKYLNKVFGSNRRQKNRYRSQLVFGVGISLNSLKITPYNRNLNITRTTFTSQTAPVIAATFHIPFQRGFGKTFLAPQVKMYQQKHTGTAPYEYVNYLAYPADTVTVKSTNINLNLFIGREWIKTDKFSWYTIAGPSLYFLLNNEIVEKSTSSDAQKKTGKNSYISFIGQTGFRFGKFGTWISYQTLSDQSDKVLYDLKPTALQFGVEYRITL